MTDDSAVHRQATNGALPCEELKLPGAGAPTLGWTLFDAGAPLRATQQQAVLLGQLHKRHAFWLKQVHLTHCVEISAARPKPAAPIEADGIITDRRDLLMGVSAADCLPLFLVSDKATAVLHAGWRGVLGGILPSAVERMKDFGVSPDQLRLFTGPGMGPCCFEVSPAVWSLFPEAARARSGHGLRLDLLRAVEDQWQRCGSGAPVHLGRCTVCSQPRLHSYRRDRGQGRNFAYLYFADVAPGGGV